MSKNDHHGKHHHQNAKVDVHQAAVPYWKRAHRDWRFIVAVVLMIVAMAAYVLSNDMAFWPRG